MPMIKKWQKCASETAVEDDSNLCSHAVAVGSVLHTATGMASTQHYTVQRVGHGDFQNV